MTIEVALAFWLARVDYERKSVDLGELKLDRMRDLLGRLGNPHERLNIVHVAGSKGKGSTAAMFAAAACAAGLRSGLFTSPHLVEVVERFQIDGKCISYPALAELLTAIRPAVESMDAAGQPPTFFEIATALAFVYFERERVNLAVMEVGLGGRFDSTNVCTPILSVITSISHDHTAILGTQLAQIAFEKCGIVKPGVPIVSGVTAPEAASVIRDICRERSSPLTELGRDFQIVHRPGLVNWKGKVQRAEVQITDNDSTSTYELALLGEHQAANASLVVSGVGILNSVNFAIPEVAVRAGLAGVEWPGRMEVLGRSPIIVLDCAHNVASALALCETLEQSFPKGHRTLVFAASSDKDVAGMMREFVERFDRFVFTRFHNNPRALATDELVCIARSVRADVTLSAFDNSEPAVHFAQQNTDLVVVAGSVFLVGELRQKLKSANDGNLAKV